jgi:hypothetical protein
LVDVPAVILQNTTLRINKTAAGEIEVRAQGLVAVAAVLLLAATLFGLKD